MQRVFAVLGALCLAAGIVIVPPLAAQTKTAHSASTSNALGGLSVTIGERTVTFTHAELVALPRTTMVINDNGDTATMSGVSLWEVLQKAHVPSPEASGRQRAAMYLRLKGTDGQNAVFALVEVDPGFSKRAVLLADHRRDQALDESEGPWRAIVPDDIRHARWIRGLTSITVEMLKL